MDRGYCYNFGGSDKITVMGNVSLRVHNPRDAEAYQVRVLALCCHINKV